METKRRKSINFDFSQRVHSTRDTKKLKELYSKNYTNAYNDIKKFLLKNDFEHTQGSGYISEKEISDGQITRLFKRMSKECSWLKDCCKTLHYSDVQPIYDGLKIIQEDKTLRVNKTKEKEKKQTYKISNYKPKNKIKNKDIER